MELPAHLRPLLLYLAGVNVLVVAAVAMLHELGHALVGAAAGCSGAAIVLFTLHGPATHTALACPPDAVQPAMGVTAALLLPVPLAAVFLALRRYKERFVGHVVLGVAVMAAAADVSRAWGGPVAAATGLAGAAVAVYGEQQLLHAVRAADVLGLEHGGAPQDS